MNRLTLFAYISGCLQILAFLPILYGIFKGKTKPSTTATGIWTFVSFTLIASSYAAGVRSNLPFIFAGCIGTTTIFILSFKYGYRRWSMIDPIAVSLGAVSLIAWVITRQASYAVYLLTLLDWVGILPVIYKSWYDPTTENKLGWFINFLACVFLLLAVSNFNPVTLVVAYTQLLHSVIINTLIRLPKPVKVVI